MADGLDAILTLNEDAWARLVAALAAELEHRVRFGSDEQWKAFGDMGRFIFATAENEITEED